MGSNSKFLSVKPTYSNPVSRTIPPNSLNFFFRHIDLRFTIFILLLTTSFPTSSQGSVFALAMRVLTSFGRASTCNSMPQ